MFLTLLASTLALPVWAQLILSLLPAIGLGVGWRAQYVKNRKEEAKEEGERLEKERKDATELEARKQDYAQFKSKMEERMTGFNVALEKVADTSKQECDAIKEKFSTVHILSDKVSTLQLTVNNTDSKVEKLEGRMDLRFSSLDTKLDSILMGLADLGGLGRKSTNKYPE